MLLNLKLPKRYLNIHAKTPSSRSLFRLYLPISPFIVVLRFQPYHSLP